MLDIDIAKFDTLITLEFTSNPGKTAAYNASQAKTLVTLAKTVPAPSAATVSAAITALPAPEKVTYARIIKFVKEFFPGVDENIDGLVTYRGFNFRTNGTALLARAKEAWAQIGTLTTNTKRYVNYVRDPDIAAASGMSRSAQSSEEKLAIELYKKWFDKRLKQTRIARVKTVLTKLQQAVNHEAFEIICEGDPTDQHGLCYPNPIAPGEFGEVRPADNRNRFYLGPIFFNELAQNIGGSCSLSVVPKMGQTYAQSKTSIFTALNASTITMLHELTHITALGGTTDNAPTPYNVDACLAKALNTPDLAVENAENYALFAKEILLKVQFEPPTMKR